MLSVSADGFGTDELRYADTGRYLDTLNIQWDAYDDKIYISYGVLRIVGCKGMFFLHIVKILRIFAVPPVKRGDVERFD